MLLEKDNGESKEEIKSYWVDEKEPVIFYFLILKKKCKII
jgi:hypothetical protein